MYIVDNNLIFTGELVGQNISTIPVGNWIVKYDARKEIYFFEKSPNFVLPDKIYGDVYELSNRYLNSFKSWNNNLGILLSGLKGTGKSLLAKKVCIDANIPVIIINEPHSGSDIITLLNQISQNCIVFIDEFEKIYSVEEQNTLLNILDGSFNTKFMFLLTINEYSRISEYLINRPGRIHYFKEYSGLDEKTIKDICMDKLDDFSKYDDIVKVCNCVGEITIDIIVSLIKEINLYPNDSPTKLLDYMNLRPTNSSTYKAHVYKNGILEAKDIYVNNNPLMRKTYELEWYGEDVRAEENVYEDGEKLSSSENVWNVINIDIDNSVIKISSESINIEMVETWFGTAINWKIVLKKNPSFSTKYSSLLV